MGTTLSPNHVQFSRIPCSVFVDRGHQYRSDIGASCANHAPHRHRFLANGNRRCTAGAHLDDKKRRKAPWKTGSMDRSRRIVSGSTFLDLVCKPSDDQRDALNRLGLSHPCLGWPAGLGRLF